jgi:rhodanese-related sulfurtransferase
MVARIIKVVAIVTVIALLSWDLVWWALGVNPVFPWTLKENIERKTNRWALLDVQSERDHALGHIRGVIWCSGRAISDLFGPHALGKGEVLVISSTGHKSAITGYKLKKLGNERVYNLVGGMVGWWLVGGPTLRLNVIPQ